MRPQGALLEWYFDTREMADAAREAFRAEGLSNIAVYTTAK